MTNKGINILLWIALLIFTSNAWAKPEVQITIKSEKEVVQMENGKEVKKRVTADGVEPGKNLFFVLNYSNSGNEKATNVVFNNPIPEGTVYVFGSATGLGSDISFSIDNGISFKKPSLLTYETKTPNGKKIKKKASPEQYSHVRWKIREIPPGGNGKLEFQVLVQ